MATDPAAGDPGTLTIQLPSKGALYKGLLPEGAVAINRMSSYDLTVVFSAGSIEQRLTKVIANTSKLPKGLTANDLLTVDRMALLLAVRIKTFGHKYEFEYECQACGSHQKHTVDIQQDLNQRHVEPMEEPFEITLPDCGKRVGLRFLRGYDEDAVAKESKRTAMASVDPGDTSSLYRVARLVASVDGTENLDIVQRERFVRELSARDFIIIENEIDAREPGIDLTVHPECGRCQAVNDMKMPFDRDFFARLPFEPDHIEAMQFFLLHHGHGFTDVGVKVLPFDELNRACRRLYDQIMAEKAAQDRAVADADARRRPRR